MNKDIQIEAQDIINNLVNQVAQQAQIIAVKDATIKALQGQVSKGAETQKDK